MMLWKGHRRRSGRTVLLCLMLILSVLHTAWAEELPDSQMSEVATPTQTVAPATPTPVVEVVEEITPVPETVTPVAEVVEESTSVPEAAPLETPSVQAQEEELPPTEVLEEDGTQLPTGPVLVVQDYQVIQGDTVPGSTFILQMNIVNYSETASAFNVLATLKIENVSVSLREGATNQVYFHEILPGEKVTVEFPLKVYSYCSEENMVLSMTMTCYDANAVHYDFQTMMTPKVDVERTLLVSSLSVPKFIHRNSSMIISATLSNIEPVTLQNIRMHLSTQYGDQVTEVGTMLSGESKTVNSIYRFPEQQAEIVNVYFTYESLSGQQYATQPQEFEVVVYDPTENTDFAAAGRLSTQEILESLSQGIRIPGTGIQLPIPVAALILAGVIGYIVVMYFALRRKRR